MRHEETGLVNEIKALRTKRGLTQEGLAEACGVTRKTINTIERGRFVPSTDLALKISAVLGVRVEDAFRLGDAP